MPTRLTTCIAMISLALASTLGAQQQGQRARRADTSAYTPAECASCAEWNIPTEPVHVYGNVYYVGTRGLSAILLTSSAGHVLIDGGLPESAPLIMASVRALGFRVEDIKLILNSHAHYDHAGGIATIQRVSGARVKASHASAEVIRHGTVGSDDPQFGIALVYPAARQVSEIADGDALRVGSTLLTAHFTPGHTPGGTSWSWRSCEGAMCLDFVYADSQTPVSAVGFYFTRSTTYPTALRDFARGFAVLETISCDVLITPHPGASQLWSRVESGALRDPEACRRYAANARQQLAKRVADEGAAR